MYLQLGQPDKAIQYFKEALPFSGISIPVDISCYGKLVRCYAMLVERHNVKKYYGLLHETIAKTPETGQKVCHPVWRWQALHKKKTIIQPQKNI